MSDVALAFKLTELIEKRQEEPKSSLQEKMFKEGARFLRDEELVSLLLYKDSDKSLTKRIKNVLYCIDKNKNKEIEQQLRNIRGLEESKICTIMVAFELGRRYYAPSYEKISSPTAILPHLTHYATRKTEHFISISLTGANEIINIRVVSIGTLMKTLVHPREVFADLIVDRAASVIFAHNHPSGNVEPSPEDIDLTYRLLEASDLLGIETLDHIIFSQRGNYVSLAERGIIETY